MRSAPRQAAATVDGGGQLRSALVALDALGIEELRAEWRRLHRVPAPPRFSHDLLLRGVAYKLQEAAIGGLPAATRRALAQSGQGGDQSRAGGTAPTTASPIRLRPGATLVREWHGHTHTVLVLADGFEHGGQRYPSLTHIARLITGARWSGPRFFGLVRPGKPADGGGSGHNGDVVDEGRPDAS